MLFGLIGRRPSESTAAVYGAIVAQARQPAFYAAAGVPDTVEGRFEMIVFHAALLFRRLKGTDAAARTLAQDVLDLFFADMDRSLREMGVGDLSMAKKMKRLGRAYAGRALAYDRALDDADPAGLEAALRRNVYAGDAGPDTVAGAPRLAAYGRAADAGLGRAPLADLVAGRIPWPDPAALIPGEPS